MTLVPLLAILVAGLSIAVAARLVRPTPADLILGLGPAYLLGTAAVSVCSIVLLVFGLSLAVAFVAAVAVVTAASVVVIARARRPAPPEPGAGLQPIAAVALAMLAAFGILGASGVIGHPIELWDAWSIYLRKAIALADAGSLDPGFFANPSLDFMHPDYPLLLPLLEAVELKLGVAADGSGLALLPWLLFIAYGWTVVFVSVRIVRSAWPLVALLALIAVPGGYQQALTGYADIPMAAMVGAGALFAGCWLRSGRTEHLVVAGLLLAGGAAAKNEGLLGAIAVLAAAALAARPPLRRRDALIAGLLVLVSVLPWRFWLTHHGIHGDVAFGDGLSPGYVADRLDRAWHALTWLTQRAVGGDWPLIVPAAVVLTALGVQARRTRPLAVFHLVAAFGFLAGLVWVYTVSRNDIGWYLGTSGSRTVTTLVLIGMSAIVHLVGEHRPDRRQT